MSREDHEQSEQPFYESLLGRGPGDGDMYDIPDVVYKEAYEQITAEPF